MYSTSVCDAKVTLAAFANRFDLRTITVFHEHIHQSHFLSLGQCISCPWDSERTQQGQFLKESLSILKDCKP